MRYKFYLWGFVLLILTSCSASSGSDSAKSQDFAQTEMNMATSMEDGEVAFSKEESLEALDEATPHHRMVIYHGNLSLEVKNTAEAMESIEKKASGYGGYIVESSTYRNHDESMSGTITARIPEERFQAFLDDTEGMAVQVYERVVTGEDVTEDYVDLESRLKSKRVVEERLLSFMEKAEKTEDLLKIANDLAKVQEEIEQLLGRMKYLENQSAFSTITISLHEDKVVVPNLEQRDLNTWDRTKKQFITSLHALLSFASGVVVVIVGNVPIIMVMALVLIPIVLIIKRRRHRFRNDDHERG